MRGGKQQQSVQLQLTISFLIVLLPLVIVSLFAVSKSQDILEEQITERTVIAMQSALEYLDLSLQGIEEISTLISTDINIIRVLGEAEQQLSSQSILEFRAVLEQIINISTINHSIAQIAIFHEPSRTMVSTDFGGRKMTNEEMGDWYQQSIAANGKNVLLIPDTDRMIYGGLDPLMNTRSITFTRQMDFYNPNREPNMLLLTVRKETLLQNIRSLNPSPNAEWYLFTPDKRLAAATSSRFDMTELAGSGSDIQVLSLPESDDNMWMFRSVSSLSRWSLVMIQPEKEVFSETRQLLIFIYVIISVSAVLAFIFSFIFYSRISRPLANLIYGMKQIRMGNFSARLMSRRRDEFSYLMAAFNQMAEEQQYLIRDIYEKQLMLAKSELKFLQAQINPHFLYNTLDSIYWSAQNYEAEEISDMVLNLSKFFRLSLSKGKETFTIRETIEHLHYYIRVQQIRFSDLFRMEIHIDEETQELHILKLILQPVVENAIIHGLEKRGDGGELVIRSKVEEDRLCLEVQDNGQGMTEDRLHRLRAALASIQKDTTSELFQPQTSEFYGLMNVKMRLVLYYGDHADLIIDSTDGIGTRINIVFPLALCQEEVRGVTSESDNR